MKNLTKIKCVKCSVVNNIPIADVRRRKYEGGVLCYKCCKKINWYNKKCKFCSDYSMCKYGAKSIMKLLEDERGV